MKTKEELQTLKEEVEALNKKLAELTEEELKQVAGGLIPIPSYGQMEGLAPDLRELEQDVLEHRTASNQIVEAQQTIPVLKQDIGKNERQNYRN
ncbi:MAG: hypothetical protein MJ086_03905 [Lachnospiraceae bacterium]|nr:hypothetical protein [Lachnospiraceae bacterium]